MTKLRFVTLLALAACGNKKEAAPSPAPGPAATSPATSTAGAAPAGTAAGKCTFTATGDMSVSVEGIATKQPPNGKAMASTDYWMTDAQLRAGLETMVGLDSKKSKAEIAAKVDEAMKQEPKVMLLLINCGDEHGSVILGPGKDSKYANVPMKPGKYPIVNSAKAGEFGAMINLRPPGGHQSFSVAEPGTLEITKFDLTGIAGTFAIKGKSFDGKQTVEIHGTFDYPCVGEACKG